MKVKFALSARAQFLDGLEYIRQDSPTAARQFREKAESVLRRLEKFPESGRSIPEFPGLSHRKVIVRPYRFLYRVWGKRSGSSRFSMVRHCLKGRITRNHLTNACIRLLRLSRLVLTHKPRQPRLQVKQTYSRPQWRMGC